MAEYLFNQLPPPYTAKEIQAFIGMAPEDQDGAWGPKTERAHRAFLGNPLDDTKRPWGRHRLTFAVIQHMLNRDGAELKIDGIVGQSTFEAAQAKLVGTLKPKTEIKSEAPRTFWDNLRGYFTRSKT